MAPAAITPPSEDFNSAMLSQRSAKYGTFCSPHMLSNLTKRPELEEYKAYSQVMPNNFRALMNSGSLVLGHGCMMPSTYAARVIATLPHHFCWLDAEYTPTDYNTLCETVRTINHFSQGRMAVVVRVPQSAPDLVTNLLKAGAAGIVFPHVQNKEQAKDLVDLCRFPPYGRRGYPPWTLYGDEMETGIEGKTYYDVWDEHICVICQIEDRDGVENVEEICAVPGVDALMVGTHDLRLELGIRPPGYFDGDEPEFQDALEKITRAAAKHGPQGMAILSFSNMGAKGGLDLEKRMHRGWRAFKINTDVQSIHKQGTVEFEKVQEVASRVVKEAVPKPDAFIDVHAAEKHANTTGLGVNTSVVPVA